MRLFMVIVMLCAAGVAGAVTMNWQTVGSGTVANGTWGGGDGYRFV